MAAANIGSAHASVRRAIAPSETISWSLLNRLIICGASSHITAPSTPIIIIPEITEMRAKLRARSLRPAPRLWPTRVVAASPTP